MFNQFQFDHDKVRKDGALDAFYDGRTSVIRVSESVAQSILLSNVSITVQGKVRAFTVEHIGLGVYKVRLSEDTLMRGNYLVQ